MDWGSLGKKILEFGATALGTAVGSPALGAVAGTLVGHALGVDDPKDPNKISAALDAMGPEQAKIKLQQIQNQHDETIAQINAAEQNLAQVNQTMRVEYGASDPYVRRWRPTWGYVSAGAWALEALAIFAAIVGAVIAALSAHQKEATLILTALPAVIGSLSALWSIALMVLGVNMRNRSRDKAIQAGKDPGPGLLDALAQRIAGSGKTEVAKLITSLPQETADK